MTTTTPTERAGPASDLGEPAAPVEIGHAALRGAIAAMAMTGMRAFTQHMGIVEQTPPQAIFRKQAHGLIRRVPRRRRRAVVELAHWAYGGGGGAAFATLPERLRRRAWAGPVYGFVLWAGFELGVAPALELPEGQKLRLPERLALATDHLLYGLVLSETRPRPQE